MPDIKLFTNIRCKTRNELYIAHDFTCYTSHVRRDQAMQTCQVTLDIFGSPGAPGNIQGNLTGMAISVNNSNDPVVDIHIAIITTTHTHTHANDSPNIM